MSAYKNVSGGLLILPDNSEIKDGATVSLSDDALGNAGVKQWIKAKMLVSDASKQQNTKTENKSK